MNGVCSYTTHTHTERERERERERLIFIYKKIHYVPSKNVDTRATITHTTFTNITTAAATSTADTTLTTLIRLLIGLLLYRVSKKYGTMLVTLLL